MKKYSVLVSNRNNRKTIEKLTPCGMEYVSICTHVRSILKIHFFSDGDAENKLYFTRHFQRIQNIIRLSRIQKTKKVLEKP